MSTALRDAYFEAWANYGRAENALKAAERAWIDEWRKENDLTGKCVIHSKVGTPVFVESCHIRVNAGGPYIYSAYGRMLLKSGKWGKKSLFYPLHWDWRLHDPTKDGPIPALLGQEASK